MNALLILILFVNFSASGTSSCKDKLQKKSWPIDCLLALKIKKLPLQSKPYNNLDLWCSAFKDDLFKNRPPKALFSLPLPPKCKKIARSSQTHHEKIDLLRGDFLNSFL